MKSRHGCCKGGSESPFGKRSQQSLVLRRGKSHGGAASVLGVLLASPWDPRQGGTAPVGIAPPGQLAEQKRACLARLCRRDGTLHGGKKKTPSGAILAGNITVCHTLPPLLWGAAPTGMAESRGWTVPPAACPACSARAGREEQTTGDRQSVSPGKQRGRGEGGGVGAVAEGRDLWRKIWARSVGSAGSSSPCAAWRRAEQEGLMEPVVMRSEPGDNLRC